MLEHLAMVEKVCFSLYYLIVCSQRSRQQYRVLERSSVCFDVLLPESKATAISQGGKRYFTIDCSIFSSAKRSEVEKEEN